MNGELKVWLQSSLNHIMHIGHMNDKLKIWLQ